MGRMQQLVLFLGHLDALLLTSRAVFDFYQNLNLFYGVVSECCTQQSCPTMSAGPSWVLISHHNFVGDAYMLPRHPRRLNYTWINTDRKHVQLPAPTYIDYVMTWVQNLLDDENTFPTKSGTWLMPSSALKVISNPLSDRP